MSDQPSDLARIHRSLTNITPGSEQIARIEHLRETAKELATAIIESCDSSRERSLALTHLEDSVMWAVKAVILEEPRE